MKPSDLDARVYAISPAIRYVAGRARITASEVRTHVRSSAVATWGGTKKLKTLLGAAAEFRANGQFGRLRGTLLIGAAELGQHFWVEAERAGILLTTGRHVKKFGTFLLELDNEFKSSEDTTWSSFSERIQTYRTYFQFVRDVERDHRATAARLSLYPRFILKDVLSVVNLAFLRKYLGFEVNDELGKQVDELGTPENIASMASALVAYANEKQPLDGADLGFPAIDTFAGEGVWHMLRFGQALALRHDIAKQISLFGYHLHTVTTGDRDVYIVRPPSSEFEIALRLGYMRSEFTSPVFDLSGQTDVPKLSLQTLAEAFVRGSQGKVCEIRDADTPLRRVRVRFPIIPEVIKMVTDHAVFDDFAQRESLAAEFMFPLRLSSAGTQGPIMLTPTLSVDDFMRIWRLFRFLALVDITATRPFAGTDQTIFRNSIVRISKEHEMVELISAIGIDPAKVHEFLGLITARADRLGFYDMQCRPFFRLKQIKYGNSADDPSVEFVHLPAVVATANILRNIQVANRFRLKDMPDAFVFVVANMLGRHFKHVATNRRVKNSTAATDIDVLVWEGGTLYLFECKHSASPTELHELRDTWEDIEKGARQLQSAQDILRQPNRLRDYLAGWFPNTLASITGDIRISCCIVCSHRVFSGMAYEGIPVRDYASLAKLTGDGIVSLAIDDQGDFAVVERFRLTLSTGFSTADLDNYLGGEAIFFRMFTPFIFPVSRLTVLPRATVAQESVVFEFGYDEWTENLQAIGATRLPDERRQLRIPGDIQELVNNLNGEGVDEEDSR